MKQSIVKWMLCFLTPIGIIVSVAMVEIYILQDNKFSLDIKKGSLSDLEDIEIDGDIYRYDGKIFTLNLKKGELNCENIYSNHDLIPIKLSSQYWNREHDIQQESLKYKKGSKKNVTRLSPDEEKKLDQLLSSDYQYRQVGEADFVFYEMIGQDKIPVETYTLKTKGQKKLIEIIYKNNEEHENSTFLYIDFSKRMNQIRRREQYRHSFDADFMYHSINDMYYKDNKLYVLWTDYDVPKLHIEIYDKNNKTFDAEINLIKEKKVNLDDSNVLDYSTVYYDFMVVR